MNTPLRLRTIRRLASLETESAEELLESEFVDRKTGGPDLQLSVYEITDEEPSVTRARTEHHASFAGPPNEALISVSLHGFPDIDVVVETGETRFDFTRKQHRTMNLLDRDELLAVVAAAIQQRVERQRSTSVEAIRGYVRACVEAKDAEWLSLIADKKRQKWGTWAHEDPRQLPLPTAPPQVHTRVADDILPPAGATAGDVNPSEPAVVARVSPSADGESND